MPSFSDAYISLAGEGTALGKVISIPASNAALVNINGYNATVRILSGVTVALNDVVLIKRHGSSRFVLGVVMPAPVADPVQDGEATLVESDLAPAPKPASVSGTLICAPTQTATYRDGTWRADTDDPVDSTDLFQGRWPGFGANTGCAFYGTKPSTLAGTTVTSCTLTLRRLAAGAISAQRPTLWLFSESVRPLGAPTLNESALGPALTVNASLSGFALPVAWGQALVDGTRGGIGVFVPGDTPYLRLAGLGSWSVAFSLSIAWTRS